MPGKEEREAIVSELEAILASRYFCNSRRYPALLRFLVEKTLDGRADELKERTLGIEVFDRPPTFDTNSDTIVRYTAGEVRKRLQLYYTELGHNPGIRIALPIGSYVPEFLHEHDHLAGSHVNLADPHLISAEPAEATDGLAEGTLEPHPAELAPHDHGHPASARQRKPGLGRVLGWSLASVAILLAVLFALNWRAARAGSPQNAYESFWAPIFPDQNFVLMCTGGVVFSLDRNSFSGVVTAGRDVDYPFISLQNASAISDVSGVINHFGARTQLVFSGSEPLTGLRENPVILLGGYNNDWTLRLLQPLRFHFTPEPVESIVDQMHPEMRWQRDRSQPYSSADDYALLARYRDSTTDSWVVALAGLGRNGTEAAAQFAVSPHYLEMLRRQMGQDFGNRNLEVLLRIKVIDGKTGAPSILAVHSW